jgi:superoxide dismutase, Fe-Mn family
MKTLDQKYQSKPLKPKQKLDGISARTLSIHHDELYEGYVKKANEIHERLETLHRQVIEGSVSGNATYSELRALKQAETYAVNGIYLHEWYFESLRGTNGDSGVTRSSAPALLAALEEEFTSIDEFIKVFSECAKCARGWTILAWDTKAHRLMIYNGDAHNQGGIWGAIPIIVLDVYEHAYFIDFGADRGAYIESYWKSFDWKAANDIFTKVRSINL